MKRVFISHKFADDPEVNKQKADSICKKIIESRDDVLPISPLHLFSYFDEEAHYRKAIMKTCLDMILFCDQVWIYIDEKISEGQQEELDFALDLGIEVKFIGS